MGHSEEVKIYSEGVAFKMTYEVMPSIDFWK